MAPFYEFSLRADFLAAAIFRPYRLTCTDLNPAFLSRLRERLARHGLEAEIVEDDIERTALVAGPDLLLATLLREHIDWRRGIEAFAGLRPKACGIIIQENQPDLTTAVTPGRRLPPSVAKAVETAHPALLLVGCSPAPWQRRAMRSAIPRFARWRMASDWLGYCLQRIRDRMAAVMDRAPAPQSGPLSG